MQPATAKSFSHYYRVLVARLPAILLISFIAAVAAYGITRSIVPQYQVHFSYVVSLSQRESSAAYRFDGYYALQAIDLFAATLASWARTPETIAAAHERAGLSLTTRDPRTLRQIVTATKTAPQLVEVTVRQPSEEQSMALAKGLQAAVRDEVSRYHQQGIPALTFTVVPTTPWVGVPAIATRVIVVAVFVFTAIGLINIVLFWESIKREPDQLARGEYANRD